MKRYDIRMRRSNIHLVRIHNESKSSRKLMNIKQNKLQDSQSQLLKIYLCKKKKNLPVLCVQVTFLN